jgi:hypothetical protein
MADREVAAVRTFRKTLKWLFLLLLTGAAVGGGYAYHLWNRSDELLVAVLTERLREIAPDWDFKVEDARFDWGRIRVDEFKLNGRDGRPILSTGVVLTLDREHLADPQTSIKSLVLRKPKVNLIRAADGSWNFQKLPPLKVPRSVIPEFHVEQMTLAVIVEGAEPNQMAPIKFDEVRLQFIPSGARQFAVKGSAKFGGSDGIFANGTWQVDAGTWSIDGRIRNLSIDAGLSQLAAEFSPDCRNGLARLDALVQKLAAAGGPPAGVPPSGGGGEAAVPDWADRPSLAKAGTPTVQRPAEAGTPTAFTRLGISAAADVRIRAARWAPGAPFEYKIALSVRNGEIRNPPAPFPLSDVQGEITLDNNEIVVGEVTARSGTTRIAVKQGRVRDWNGLRPAEFDVEITRLALDQRVPSLMPALMQKIYSEARPGGEVDLQFHLAYDGERWTHTSDLVARNCTVNHEKFPYRIEQIEGKIWRRGELVELELNGRAGSQRVNLTGRVKNPGPEAACLLVIKSAGIPIDERLFRACPPKIQAVIEHLRASAELEGTVRIERPPGPRQSLTVSVDAAARNGSINCRSFPFPIVGVSGKFSGTGENWKFAEFKGRHGPTEVRGAGAFGADQLGRPELELDFSAVGATFDRSLFEALPESCQAVWTEVNPRGGLNVAGKLFWNAAEPVPVRLEGVEVEVFDAGMKLRSFPFSIIDAAGMFRINGSQVAIKSFSGRHEEMTLRIDEGLASVYDDGQWRVHLEKIYVDNLEATPEFRRALPQPLRTIVDALNPRGKQSISGKFQIRGKCGDEYPVTAAWYTETDYAGTTITAGVDLKDIFGKAIFSGTWDGEQADGEGRIELQSVNILKHQFTDVRGPVRIHRSRLVLGSPEAGRAGAGRDGARRLTARFIDGLVSLDANVDISERMTYEVHSTLKGGNLKRYAQLHMAGNNKLAGTMDGQVFLRGEGTNPKGLTGSGQLVISQAALYELPVIVQIFNVLSFVPPDKKAFDTAEFVFDIAGGVFHFGNIRLVGDSIVLVGRGTVGFDGNVKLGFGSRMGRRQFNVPILKPIVNEMTKGSVGVEVTGTLQDPKTQVRPFMQLEEGLRRLLQQARDPRVQRPR